MEIMLHTAALREAIRACANTHGELLHDSSYLRCGCSLAGHVRELVALYHRVVADAKHVADELSRLPNEATP